MASTVTELLRRRFGGKSLPYDAEVEYLESSVGSNNTVNQYIDTGYLGTLNNKYEIKFTYYERQAIFGSRSTNTNAVIISIDRCRFGGTTQLYALSANVTYIVTLDKDAYIINGTTYNLGQTTEFTTDNNITLFSANKTSVSRARARIYYFKMWDGNTLVRDMIPVRIGTTGYMYDRVSGQLFGNAGTGDFVLGPDKYGIIYSASNVTYDGTNNTDTGIYLMDGENFKITINYQPTATTGKFIACRNPSTLKGFDLRISNGKIDFVRDNSDIYLSNVSVGDTINLTITKIGSTITVTDGVLSGSGIITDTDKTLFIGSDCNGQGKSQFILNNITVERFK